LCLKKLTTFTLAPSYKSCFPEEFDA
jgi:hypothetical protein